MKIIHNNDINPDIPVQYIIDDLANKKLNKIHVYGYGHKLKKQGIAISYIRITNTDYNPMVSHAYLTEEETEALILALTHTLKVYRGTKS